MKLDESCSSNPKSEIADWTVAKCEVQFKILDFGFALQDSSNFKILPLASTSHAARLLQQFCSSGGIMPFGFTEGRAADFVL